MKVQYHTVEIQSNPTLMYSMHPMMSSMGAAIYATDSVFENETLTVLGKKWPFLPPARCCVVEILLLTYGTSSSHVPTIPNESNQHRTVDKKGDEQYCIRFLFY
mmetsp:Transcript_19051/g.21306  ORF Transcript_19051/g.21306 Transcript_19051/m.21306 type:complete len:104 (+) Transcript_19051:102-413(+)